jgi:putative ABC transport system permease protein
MIGIALKMLTGDRTKYLGILFGVSFSALLMAHQLATFCGVLALTTNPIRDIEGGDLWVMDPDVLAIDEFKPLSDSALYRVRSVPGVRWAVPLLKGVTRVHLMAGPAANLGGMLSRPRADLVEGHELEGPGKHGTRPGSGDATPIVQQIMLYGLDETTLLGGPRLEKMVAGGLGRLEQPDAVLIDRYSCELIWPAERAQLKRPEDYGRFLGRDLEINDHRAVVGGIFRASSTNFQTLPVLYTTLSRAKQFMPPQRRLLTFVLVKAEEDILPTEVGNRIQEQTGLKALTYEEFCWATIHYYMTRTGIPVNFGITVLLSFLVGTAIAGQTFYQFTLENLKYFATLKAMGTSNPRLLGLVLLQALVVGPMGYSLGVGLAALFGFLTRDDPTVAFYMPWQVLALTGIAVVFICLLASLFSIRRVLVLEPALVFR